MPTFRNALSHLHRRVGKRNVWVWEMLVYFYLYFPGKPFPISIPQHFSNLDILHTYPPMRMEQTQCSETSAYIIQTPGKYPEESVQHSENGGSFKSRTVFCFNAAFICNVCNDCKWVETELISKTGTYNFHYCRWHTFTRKALLCNTQYLRTVQSNSTTTSHTELIVVSTTKWLRQRATVSPYTGWVSR